MTGRCNVAIGILLALLSFGVPDLAAAQATTTGSGTLKVTGEVRTPLSLSPDELKSMPRKRVEVS